MSEIPGVRRKCSMARAVFARLEGLGIIECPSVNKGETRHPLDFQGRFPYTLSTKRDFLSGLFSYSLCEKEGSYQILIRKSSGEIKTGKGAGLWCVKAKREGICAEGPDLSRQVL